MQQKLEILYQRDLYVMAINFAQKAGVDAAQRNVILRKYGDYLYKKGDYDTAMQQYLKAIDNTEPSQVIRKAGSARFLEFTADCNSSSIPSVSITLSSILKNCMNTIRLLSTILHYY